MKNHIAERKLSFKLMKMAKIFQTGSLLAQERTQIQKKKKNTTQHYANNI